MADLSAPITQRLVTFERIGRFRDIDALLLAGDDFDDHAATVYRHARRYLGSKEFSVTVTEDYVSIEADRLGLYVGAELDMRAMASVIHRRSPRCLPDLAYEMSHLTPPKDTP